MLFRVRTITAFVMIGPSDFNEDNTDSLESKIRDASSFLSTMQKKLSSAGFEVQTVRIATNPFGDYLKPSSPPETASSRLQQLQALFAKYDISFCSLGPAQSLEDLQLCPMIVAKGMSCSARVLQNDVTMARAVANGILDISRLNDPEDVMGGLGNFRFCATGSCPPGIPFFPASYAGNDQSFALGLENGPLAYHLIAESGSIANIPTTFCEGMTSALRPLHEICQNEQGDWKFLGIDTSLNPSLDSEHGSVAAALEQLDEVETFGGPGTVAAAASITLALQSLPGITKSGYCGFMLPVCEDLRLAELSPNLRISNLLSISAVCGVGVDTVPVAGNVPPSHLASLILDVVNLAARWNKPLSCRVFPVPGSVAGDTTQFDASPYLCNSQIFQIE